MTYAEICADNKYLYGKLEQCAREIKYKKDTGKKRQATEMTKQYNSIMILININLELLEACWKESRQMYMQVTDETALIANKKDAAVINVFLDNPDSSVEDIAVLASVHKSTAARIISDWYRHKDRKEGEKVNA